MRKQIAAFTNSLRRHGLNGFEEPANWLGAFELLKDLIEISPAGKKVIFLDELSWMDTPRSDLMTALEGFWNGWASARKDIVLVVCASATSWMVDNVIHNKGGLYNRLTKQIDLAPFTLGECRELAEANGLVMNNHELLEAYMIMGGVPYYWGFLQRGLSLAQNVDAMFFSSSSLLKDEFDYLYRSLFRNPEKYMKIIDALSRSSRGLTRKEILAATKMPSSGNFSKYLADLERCGFVKSYAEFGKSASHRRYELVDNFTLFYYKFLAQRPTDEHFWSNQTDAPSRQAWCGLAFERVCMEHVPQIKEKLGISGVLTNVYTWRCSADPDNGVFGSQIDLLIARRDQVINLCEMKYSSDDYAIRKDVDAALRHKVSDFAKLTKTKSSIHLTLVTTYGLSENAYSGRIQSVITGDDLIR